MKKINRKQKVLTTNLGERSLNKQHNNRTIVIPKVAIENFGIDARADKITANVELVQEANGDNYLKVTPTKNEKRSRN